MPGGRSAGEEAAGVRQFCQVERSEARQGFTDIMHSYP
jgi:hypothetical protein